MLTRRQWLSGMAALVAGCAADDGTGKAGGGTPEPGTELELWRALREALAESPDHLRARAAAAVASKDAKRIFEFVRDSIAAVPPLDPFESIATAVRFGTDNLLRTGVGTPRERAELLVRLLDDAGFSASVVVGDGDGPLYASEAPKAVYLPRPSLPFEPGPPPGGGSWEDTAPADAEAPQVLDANGAESEQLFEELRALLPADIEVTPPYLGSFFGMPLVALEEGGNTTYLNTLLEDAEYGESYATNIQPAEAADAPRSVLVRLSATRARAVDEPVTLAEATFGYDELAGARLRVSPQPLLDLPSFLGAKPLEVGNFVTGFALVGADGRPKKFARGSAISAVGDIVEASGKSVTVSGVPQATGGDPADVTGVAALARAPGAPIVEVEVAPTDSRGDVVVGLPASAFVLEEDGVPVSAVIRENGGAPRVLVLWDGSGSQPILTDATAEAIAAAVFDAVPNATVQVSAVDGAPSASAYTLTDAESVKGALLAVSGLTSTVYAGLLAAFASAPTLIVLFTNGDVEDSPALAAACLGAAGTFPIVAIGCHESSSTTTSEPLEELADKSGGTFVDGGDLSDLGSTEAAIGEVGARRSERPYRLGYVSPGKAGRRELRVTVGDADTSVSFELETDTSDASGRWSEFVGMHLHLEMDGVSVDRTLAGLAPEPLADVQGAADALATASRAVRDFLLSSTWLTFEGGPPTLSAWLDDALGAALGWEPVAQAIAAEDTAGAYAATEDAPMRPLPRSLLVHAPLAQPEASAQAWVSETALRACLHITLPLAARTSVDILPTTRFTALGADDGKLAFDHVMRASLRLAIAESEVAQGSTRASLEGVPLTLLPPGEVVADDLDAFPEEQREAMAAVLGRYANGYRLHASDGSTRAFWTVDRTSGTALGVLPDGSGGAIEECKELVNVANVLMDQLSVAVGLIDAGLAPSFVVISAVGKAAAISVAEAALSFTDPLINPSIWQLGETILCSAASDGLGNVIPGGAGGLSKVGAEWAKSAAASSVTESGLMCKPVGVCTPKPGG